VNIALPATESVAKFLRDAGYTSSADELFKERAAMVDVLVCGREWLSAATPENRRAMIAALKRAGAES
jgi:hypothetical protein